MLLPIEDIQWEYLSRVSWIEERLSRCWTSFGREPRDSSRVTHVCRRSCQRMSSSPACRSRGLKCRLMIFCESMGLPMVVANTSPLSTYRAPALTRCAPSPSGALVRKGQIFIQRLAPELEYLPQWPRNSL